VGFFGLAARRILEESAIGIRHVVPGYELRQALHAL